MATRRWRRQNRGRAIAPIIATILLLAMTVIAAALLFSFKFYTPPSTPAVTIVIHSGGSNPVWGDGTDTPHTCSSPGTCYSLMNTSQIIIASASPTNVPLDLIDFTFICDNTSVGGNRTILVQGTLASMTWFPGSTTSPPAGAPDLGWCASFHAGGFGGSDDTLYNRLGLFVPIAPGYTVLTAGDTFILYIHNGGYPLDYDGGSHDCTAENTVAPCFDADDYHGAPPWCFTNPGACTIYLSYVGSPSSLIATIPVYSLAPPPS
jgi:flagellin-like protein